MNIFPFKKSKKGRKTNRRKSIDWWSRIHLTRSGLVRLCLSFVALVFITIVVQAWSTPFPYRFGDRVPHGILARIDFSIPDKFETDRAQKIAEESVPFVFRNDPKDLKTLPERLQASLGIVAEADSLDDLPEDVKARFGLNNPEREPEFMFRQLKSAVVPSGTGSADTQISNVVEEFKRLINPITRTGILAQADVMSHDITDAVAIIPAEARAVSKDDDYKTLAAGWREVAVVDVRLTDLMNDAGLIGSEWRSYPLLDPIRPMLEAWLKSEVKSSLKFDQKYTQEAKSLAKKGVEPVTNLVVTGNELLGPNEVINAEHLKALREEHQQAEANVAWYHSALRVAVVFVLLSILAGLNGYYLVKFESKIVHDLKQYGLFLLFIVVAAGLGKLAAIDPIEAEVIAIVVVSMVFAVVYNQVLASLVALSLSLVLTLSVRPTIEEFVLLMSTSATAIAMLSRVQSRLTIIKAGFVCGFVYFTIACGLSAIQQDRVLGILSDQYVLLNSLQGAGWCVVAGYFVAGSLPVLEKLFGIVTGISLLELSNPSHPLLQELVREAPGTYNHSITVATMAEAAAEKIGANGLLVRIGAYFHDIGKIPKSEYFIENKAAGAPSRHDKLAPAMSTLIIIGHVKEGVDMAHRHNLPPAIIDFIEQHHGTTLVEYFYNAATKKADEDPDKPDVQESAFRYPGPKPQTKETGIMMLTDAVESASRTLSEPTPARIESLVHSLTMKRLLDGQFDECSLTLSEIRTIERSLVKSLNGIYHGRIAYPERKTAS